MHHKFPFIMVQNRWRVGWLGWLFAMIWFSVCGVVVVVGLVFHARGIVYAARKLRLVRATTRRDRNLLALGSGVDHGGGRRVTRCSFILLEVAGASGCAPTRPSSWQWSRLAMGLFDDDDDDPERRKREQKRLRDLREQDNQRRIQQKLQMDAAENVRLQKKVRMEAEEEHVRVLAMEAEQARQQEAAKQQLQMEREERRQQAACQKAAAASSPKEAAPPSASARPSVAEVSAAALPVQVVSADVPAAARAQGNRIWGDRKPTVLKFAPRTAALGAAALRRGLGGAPARDAAAARRPPPQSPVYGRTVTTANAGAEPVPAALLRAVPTAAARQPVPAARPGAVPTAAARQPVPAARPGAVPTAAARQPVPAARPGAVPTAAARQPVPAARPGAVPTAAARQPVPAELLRAAPTARPVQRVVRDSAAPVPGPRGAAGSRSADGQKAAPAPAQRVRTPTPASARGPVPSARAAPRPGPRGAGCAPSRVAECTLCGRALQSGSTKTLRCGHRFHSRCLSEWAEDADGECPECDEDEEGDDGHLLEEIRSMFRRGPKRPAYDEEYDSSDMEATYDDVEAEEHFSRRVGAREDAEELKKILEEEAAEAAEAEARAQQRAKKRQKFC